MPDDDLALRARVRKEVVHELTTLLREVGRQDANVILLTDYEAANLREALIATGYGSVYRSPLQVLNNGDWLGQIVLKLQNLAQDHWVCGSAQTLAERANDWRGQ